jgi:hypothetical protein
MMITEWNEKLPFNGYMNIDAASFNGWIEECIKPLGIKLPTDADSDWMDNVQKVGNDFEFGLRKFKVERKNMFGHYNNHLEVILHGRVAGEVRFSDDVWIPILSTCTTTWMSLTPSEIFSQRGGIRRSKGNCLMGGLGMGWLARRCLERSKVNKLTVYEMNGDIAKFFGDPLKAQYGDRIEIKVCDIWEAQPEDYDSILLDIWEGCDHSSSDRNLWEWKKEHSAKIWAWR